MRSVRHKPLVRLRHLTHASCRIRLVITTDTFSPLRLSRCSKTTKMSPIAANISHVHQPGNLSKASIPRRHRPTLRSLATPTTQNRPTPQSTHPRLRPASRPPSSPSFGHQTLSLHRVNKQSSARKANPVARRVTKLSKVVFGLHGYRGRDDECRDEASKRGGNHPATRACAARAHAIREASRSRYTACRTPWSAVVCHLASRADETGPSR